MSPFSSPPSLISCLAPSRPDADLTNERRNPRLFLHHSIQQAVTISGATIDHAVIPCNLPLGRSHDVLIPDVFLLLIRLPTLQIPLSAPAAAQQLLEDHSSCPFVTP
ncbi:hypothetical protein D1007_06229 [Hordeum vulgare]|nr:hypothetical protein D1007_06229 [Hordeum vulgare]